MRKKTFIPISALMAALMLALVAAMTPFVAEHNLAYAQTAVSLTSITLAPSNTGVSPESVTITASDLEYDVRFPNNTGGQVTVTGNSPIPSTATITVNGQANGSNVGINPGLKTNIRVMVRAVDGTSKTYMVKLYRKASNESDDATLKSLSLSGVSFGSFSRTKTSYMARVPAQGRTQTTVMYETNHDGALASVTAPASDADDDADGFQVDLDRGVETTITVTVSSEEATDPGGDAADFDGDDANSKTYTITVYRERISKLDDNNLSTLELNHGSGPTNLFGDSSSGTLGTFAPATKSYTGRVSSAGPSVVTVDATKMDAGAMIGDITPADADADISGHQVELRKGTETVISVPVTAEDGTSKTYMVKLYRKRSAPMDDATLKSLSLSGVSFGSFASDKMTYTARVPAQGRVQTTVMYEANDVGALASVTAPVSGDADDADGFQVDLDRGVETTITVTVNSEEATDPGAETVVPMGPGQNQKAYTITVYRERISKLDDNNLSTLELNHGSGPTNLFGDSSSGTLGTFAPATKSYTGRVSSAGPSVVTVDATKMDAGAMIGDITPADADADISGHQVELRKGTETVISVPVTAEDGTSKTYMVKLYRKRSAPMDDATLKSLSLSGVSFGSFASDKMTYTARVAENIEETTVMYEATDVGALASVTAPASDADDDADGFQVDLDRGVETTITVTVSSEEATDPGGDAADFDGDDANSKTYTIIVYRSNISSSDDNNLSTLELNHGSGPTNLFGDSSSGTLGTFAPATKSYTGRVSSAGPSVVTVDATKMDAGAMIGDITPADADSDNTGHQVELRKGTETVISVPVTAEDGTSKTYMVKLYRKRSAPMDDATLKSLSLSGVSLSGSFASDKMTYTATGAYSVSRTTVMYEANDVGALASVTAPVSGDADDADGFQVDLDRGMETTITVTVNSEEATDPGGDAADFDGDDANSKTYTITVYRGTEPSNDAKLSDLMLSGLTLMPAFDPATTAYTAEVETLETTTVEAMSTHPGATVQGTGERSLSVGDNRIRVTVTAEDGTSQTYTVTVTVIGAGTLLDRYDADDSGDIDLTEVSAAIDDYFEGQIDLDAVSAVIDLYFG